MLASLDFTLHSFPFSIMLRLFLFLCCVMLWYTKIHKNCTNYQHIAWAQDKKSETQTRKKIDINESKEKRQNIQNFSRNTSRFVDAFFLSFSSSSLFDFFIRAEVHNTSRRRMKVQNKEDRRKILSQITRSGVVHRNFGSLKLTKTPVD